MGENDGASLGNFDESVGREARLRQTREAIEYESWTSTISSLFVSAEAREIALNALELPGKLLTSVLPP